MFDLEIIKVTIVGGAGAESASFSDAVTTGYN